MAKRCTDYAELDLFSAPCENNQIEKKNWVEISTKTTLSEKLPETLLFEIEPASDRKMIDLSGIQFKAHLFFKRRSNAPDGAYANNVIHTLIKNVIIKLNDETLADSNGLYPYSSYFIDLLDTSQEQKEGLMTVQGWYQDTAGEFERHDATNKGWEARKDLTFSKAATDGEFVGKLHVDFLNQERYLIPGVKITIEMTLTKPEFHINSKHSTTSVYAEAFKHASLFVPYVQLSDKSMTEIKETLKKTPALYPIQRVVTKNFPLPSKTTQVFKIDDISKGRLPKKLIVAFTTDKAMTGDVNLNPFTFLGKHVSFTLTKIELNVDGMPYAKRAFTPNFAVNEYADSYMNFFESLNFQCDPTNSPSIKYSDFDDGYCIFPFNLNPACISDPGFFTNLGTLGLEITFEKAPLETIQVIVMAIYDNCVSIDNEHRFTKDW